MSDAEREGPNGQKGPFVLIAGLPRSGNRLISQIVVWSGVPAVINHTYRERDREGWKTCSSRLSHVIVPVRDIWVWKQSIQTLEKDWRDTDFSRKRRKLIEELSKRPHVKVYLLSYEALVSNPLVQIMELYLFLGVTNPLERSKDFLRDHKIYDGNQKYYDRLKSV